MGDEAEQNSSSQIPVPASVPTSTLEVVSENERLISAVGYISFFCLLPIILRKESDFCQTHGYQALALALALYSIKIIGPVLSILPLINQLPIWFILNAAEILIILYAGLRAYRGERFVLPLVGEWGHTLKGKMTAMVNPDSK